MRISSLLPLLALAACGQSEQQAERYDDRREVADAPKFFCAQGGGDLIAQCTAERTRTAAGWAMTVRHPNGHFRRLAISEDARTVTAADGAEPATVTLSGDQMEIAVGGDRYRLPTLR